MLSRNPFWMLNAFHPPRLIFTARIRSLWEGNFFQLWLSVVSPCDPHPWCYLSQVTWDPLPDLFKSCSPRDPLTLYHMGTPRDLANRRLAFDGNAFLQTKCSYGFWGKAGNDGLSVLKLIKSLTNFTDEFWTDEPKLFPTDPFQRAHVRLWADHISKKVPSISRICYTFSFL